MEETKNIQTDKRPKASGIDHNPVRYADESYEDYRNRRNASNLMAKDNARIGQGKRTSRELFREQLRSEGKMKNVAGSYGKGLRNWINQKEAAKLKNKEK